MRILITGANGYIGSALYKALSQDWANHVICISRDIVDLTDIRDVCDFFKSQEFFDCVIHCAVVGTTEPKRDGYDQSKDWSILDQNLLMYYNLMQYKDKFNRFIHLGSGVEIDYDQEETPYALSKKIIAKSIDNNEHFYNIRLFGLFDENELDLRFIKSNLKRYINKQPIKIVQNKQMTFFYMKDFIKVIEYYLDYGNHDIPKNFECAYENNYTLCDLGLYINSLSNYKVEIEIEKPWIDVPYIGYFTKDLGIEFEGLEQGILNTYKALKNGKN